MKAIMVLFDSLNRRFLPSYGCDWVHAPNFARLAGRTVSFDNCYAGSLPCMPARREMHTGRYNFLHRSWGPLEPFDDSVPEMLKDAGVHTHLVTDHQHYWEDGGATYHNRFSTYEFFRGQEGDAWKGHVADPEIPDGPRMMRHGLWRQDWINRTYLQDQADHPQTRTFDAGLEFLATNAGQDDWFLQIECFDPHEPFFSYADHKKHYDPDYTGPHFDWPDYKRVDEGPEVVQHARDEYAALLTMCDASLGRVLDFMDEHSMWDDTLLMVCTDHGFLLGEHGWWGKNIQPWYDETAHTPLFVWDPRSADAAGERRGALVQTIDFGPTLLDFFGVDATPRMQGRSLAPAVARDEPLREAGLFGSFGGHVNVTDGRYVYMRACASPANTPIYEHTLMPTHMNARFGPAELADAELLGPLPFTQGAPVLRVPGSAWGSPYAFGTLLFDLETDPDQQTPIVDDEQELRMIGLLLDLMRATDAPASQYERLGLPLDGPADESHLQVRRQLPQAEAARRPVPEAADFRAGWPSVNSPLRRLLDDPATRPVLERHIGVLPERLTRPLGDTPLVRLATVNPAFGSGLLQAIDDDLAAL
ncbi:sulfatase [Actinomadura violacea]|uniref:Sulfatase n=1 Tax=Actinomadura violacea TaxID=2819934 RepID=A0ABS3RT50_9ACTN|nr:sulfatase [Actinomadura violacea]MBO2459941.1 sulfatase [Actinomadura violacea]